MEASYLDMNYETDDLFAKSAAFVLTGKVQGSSTNMAPMFDGTRAMRYVPENSAVTPRTLAARSRPRTAIR